MLSTIMHDEQYNHINSYATAELYARIRAAAAAIGDLENAIVAWEIIPETKIVRGPMATSADDALISAFNQWMREKSAQKREQQAQTHAAA